MQPKYKIVRTIKRVITWFFPEETETIYCMTITGVNSQIKEGDVVYKNINGRYVEYSKYEEAERILHNCIKQYNESSSIQQWGNYEDHWDYNNEYQRILDRLNKWRD